MPLSAMHRRQMKWFDKKEYKKLSATKIITFNNTSKAIVGNSEEEEDH